MTNDSPPGSLASDRAPETSGASEERRVALRILGTSDLHSNIFAYDYYRDRPDDTVGLAKTAALIRAARAEVANAILFDNGDIIQGTPLADYVALAKGLKPQEIHPMIAAMNTLDYAACAIGNHEFNYGLDFLQNAMSGANFPCVCCNVFKTDGTNLFRPWIVIDKRLVDDAGGSCAIRIGVIGFTPPQIVEWDLANLRGRAVAIGIVEAAKRFLPEVRAAGADIVVVLCHSGVSGKPPLPGDENAAVALAAVDGFDAIITGHQHLLLPGPDFAGLASVDAAGGHIAGKPAFMPGFWGSHVGVIDIDLRLRQGAWRIAGAKVEARAIYARTGRDVTPLAQPEPDVEAAAQQAHIETLNYVRSPVGDIATPINTYFALIADNPAVQIVNAAQAWYLKRLVAARDDLKDATILSAAAPFKCGGRGGPDYFTDVKAGPIAIKDIADLYLYPNALRAVRVDGATLREWLERSAAIFRRIDPNSSQEQELLDPTFASYNFDVIDGVTYAIDVTQPSRYDADGMLVAPGARRIVDLRFNGEPVDERQTFLVATNNYRASGGGGFPGCVAANIALEAPDANRDALLHYFLELKHLEPQADGNWKFAPWPGNVVATFATSPAAISAAPPSGVKLTPLGLDAAGFERFRIELAG